MKLQPKRAKNLKLKEDQIVAYSLKTPRLQRTELAEIMQSEISWDGKPPEIEVLERKISEYRNHADSLPKDKPWNLGKLSEYPISSETLPRVLEALAIYRSNKETFTIRIALWVSRLAGVLPDFKKTTDKTRRIWNLVPWYALRELACDAQGKELDTSDLDEEILKLLSLEEGAEKEELGKPWVVVGEDLINGSGQIRGHARVIRVSKDKHKGQSGTRGGTK